MTADLPAPPQRWRLVWLALVLHTAGLAVDTAFHDSRERPFGLFEMLWAHGLSYLGAVAAIIGGWRAARASGAGAGCRWVGTVIAGLGVVQALALAVDFVTELADAQQAASSVVYVLALMPMLLGAFAGALLCRRAKATPGGRGPGL